MTTPPITTLVPPPDTNPELIAAINKAESDGDWKRARRLKSIVTFAPRNRPTTTPTDATESTDS